MFHVYSTQKTGALIDYVSAFAITVQDYIHIDARFYYMYAYIPTSELDQQALSKTARQ
jgi:hypothetical protein